MHCKRKMHIHAFGWIFHVSQKKETYQQGTCSMISPGQASEHAFRVPVWQCFWQRFYELYMHIVILLQFVMD
jgi:hypothetical protein